MSGMEAALTGQVGFTLRGRNPDVLTCIANLSNDEVFTPPEFTWRQLCLEEHYHALYARAGLTDVRTHRHVVGALHNGQGIPFNVAALFASGRVA